MTSAATDKLYLVGFMGSGKTTVARALGRRLGWRVIDLDEEIERLDLELQRRVEHAHRMLITRAEVAQDCPDEIGGL